MNWVTGNRDQMLGPSKEAAFPIEIIASIAGQEIALACRLHTLALCIAGQMAPSVKIVAIPSGFRNV